jgi:hypothetical protein
MRFQSGLANQTDDERYDRNDRKDEKQNLGDLHGACRNSTESENRGDQSDYEKYDGIVQHDFLPEVHGTSHIAMP